MQISRLSIVIVFLLIFMAGCHTLTVDLSKEEIRNLILETQSGEGLCLNSKNGIKLILSAVLGNGEKASSVSNSGYRQLRPEDFHFETNYGSISSSGILKPPDNPRLEDLKKEITITVSSRFNTSVTDTMNIQPNFSCNTLREYTGQRGTDGSPGETGQSGGGPGQPGRLGTDGTAASQLEVSIRSLSNYNVFEISIKHTLGTQIVYLDNSGRYQLIVNADGGAGGAGGRGGEGGYGTPASDDFLDAKQGGPGGDGGRGGDGGNGGRGADIMIRYENNLSGINNLLKISNNGGSPGASGEGGLAGAGGSGGESQSLKGMNVFCNCAAGIPMMILGEDKGYKDRHFFESRGSSGSSGQTGLRGSPGLPGSLGQIKEIPY